jgi:tRNA G18 (ribose-2'-O)-methylase SpoU
LKKDQNYLLIFGNEDRGLLKSTMDKSKFVIKIGNKSSEPLRATQAAVFALGYLFK